VRQPVRIVESVAIAGGTNVEAGSIEIAHHVSL
jgi:hypothetical protein